MDLQRPGSQYKETQYARRRQYHAVATGGLSEAALPGLELSFIIYKLQDFGQAT